MAKVNPYDSGYRDAKNGLSPLNLQCRDDAVMYMAGYEDACEAIQAAKFN